MPVLRLSGRTGQKTAVVKQIFGAEFDLPGGAVKQAKAQSRFQSGNSAADRGFGQARAWAA